MSTYDLACSIINNAAPGVARDYVDLVLGSDDPEVKRRYIELANKLNQKGVVGSGVVVNFVFDMANGFKASDTPVLPEVVDVEALPAPDAATQELRAQQTLDLDSLLGVGSVA